MAHEYQSRVCCFGVVETYVDDGNRPLPARAAQRPATVMVERPHVSRIPYVSQPPPASEYRPATEPDYVCVAVPSTQASTDNQATAERIAEILAPITIANTQARRHSVSDVTQNGFRYETEARAERNAINEQYIEEEAIRRVRERNRRDDRRAAELRAMENEARQRIENDFRSSTSSARSRGSEYNSRERLVIVEQSTSRSEGLTNHRCSSCHSLGHRSRDCTTVVTVSISRPERRRSVSYHRVDAPRRQVRHVPGL
jgi:hypothetical protein